MPKFTTNLFGSWRPDGAELAKWVYEIDQYLKNNQIVTPQEIGDEIVAYMQDHPITPEMIGALPLTGGNLTGTVTGTESGGQWALTTDNDGNPMLVLHKISESGSGVGLVGYGGKAYIRYNNTDYMLYDVRDTLPVFETMTDAKANYKGNVGFKTLGWSDAYDGGGGEYYLEQGDYLNQPKVGTLEDGRNIFLAPCTRVNIRQCGFLGTIQAANLQEFFSYPLFFPAQEYTLTATLKPATSIDFMGETGSVIRCTGNNTFIYISTPIQDIKIDGLYIKNTRGDKEKWGVYFVEGTNHITIKNCSFEGFSSGIYFSTNCWAASVQNCSFVGNEHGIFVRKPAHAIHISECYFRGNDIGLRIEDDNTAIYLPVDVENSIFQDNKLCQIWHGRSAGQINIRNCYIEWVDGYGVIAGTRVNYVKATTDTPATFNLGVSTVGAKCGTFNMICCQVLGGDNAINCITAVNVENLNLIGCFIRANKSTAKLIYTTKAVTNINKIGCWETQPTTNETGSTNNTTAITAEESDI